MMQDEEEAEDRQARARPRPPRSPHHLCIPPKPLSHANSKETRQETQMRVRSRAIKLTRSQSHAPSRSDSYPTFAQTRSTPKGTRKNESARGRDRGRLEGTTRRKTPSAGAATPAARVVPCVRTPATPDLLSRARLGLPACECVP